MAVDGSPPSSLPVAHVDLTALYLADGKNILQLFIPSVLPAQLMEFPCSDEADMKAEPMGLNHYVACMRQRQLNAEFITSQSQRSCMPHLIIFRHLMSEGAGGFIWALSKKLRPMPKNCSDH